ncbi:MAG TPA: class I mannose-6-phosphate isomerase [Candidatus Sumerlaeia bacterium]|nr:class I mannose-6-phosphate isomerase [Candidatus Sumerlaeia bacterium]
MFKAKPWGGRKMETVFGKPLPQGQLIGESWEVADLKEGASLIANGALAGKTLTDAVRLWGAALIGTAWDSAERFPLLVKILDAQEDLSVQVHPDSESCRRHFPDCHSKDETWLILQNDPEAGILWGFRRGASLEDFEKHLQVGEIAALLRRVDVCAGDFIRNEPGVVHALLGGILVMEVQEPSDTTFRIYDYGRIVDGKPRPIHVEQAKKVMKFDWAENPKLAPKPLPANCGNRELIVDCPAYRMESWTFSGEIKIGGLAQTARVIFCAEGRIQIADGVETFEMRAGDTAIIPAAVQSATLTAADSARLIISGAGAHSLQ